jgi:arylsulfatase A-like enzyme
MLSSSRESFQKSTSFWHFFRLIFLVFSLYLMGDAFYRWDGLKLYMTFSELLPSIALASIIWSILAFITALAAWFVIKVCQRICTFAGIRVGTEHILFFGISFFSLGFLAWAVKKLIWSDMQMALQLKLVVFAFMFSAVLILSWLFRGRAEKWLDSMNQRITPLVWLFGIFVILSVPLVAFNAWGPAPGKSALQTSTSSQSAGAHPDLKRPNILLVTFDALTARDMSVYGYKKATTPFIKKWAETASLFTWTEAASSYTGPTTASIMTGKRVWTHRRYHQEKAARPVKSDIENLARVLKNNGYHNYAFVQNSIASVDSLGIADSFDMAPMVTDFVTVATVEGFIEKQLYNLFGKKFKVHNWLGQDDFIFTTLLRKFPQKIYITENPPEMVFNRFLDLLDGGAVGPFFAWLHVMPPHTPYLPPRPYAGTFNKSWEMREQNILENFRSIEYMQYARKKQPLPEKTKAKAAILRDFYDEFILYCDSRFKDFIKDLKKRNTLENTVIILSADHGESFDLEHNFLFHGGFHLYDQVTHIPLIIKEPGQTTGNVIDRFVEQIDIPATILDLTGIPVPEWMEGRSLVPLLHNKALPPRPVLSMLLPQNNPSREITKGTFSVYEGDYKLIYYLEDGKTLLFNLRKDPAELFDLLDSEPERGRRLLAFLKNNLRKANDVILKGE